VPYNELEVREKTRSPLISELKFVNSIEYSYSIQSVDSLGRFLSGIPDELLELRTDGDSILQIISCELKSKPEGYPKFIRFTFYFEKLVDRVENNSYSKVWWDEKRQGNQVDFNIFPEKLWKKRGELEIVVKLKG
jgi:hypothetical protein